MKTKQNKTDRSIDKYMDIDNTMDMNIDINVDMYIAIEMEIGCAWHVSNVVFIISGIISIIFKCFLSFVHVFLVTFRCLGGQKGSLWVLGAPWSPKGAPRGVVWGSLGVPWGPRALLGGALGASWETLEATLGTLGHPWGVPGELLGDFWVPKSMQKLETIDLNIYENHLF